MSKLDRRRFLQRTSLATAGLCLGVSWTAPHRPGAPGSPTPHPADAPPAPFSPNAYLEIRPDDTVTIWVTKSEMGQGVRTSLPMVLADELEADWNRITLRQASPDGPFKDLYLGTSGSGSTISTWRTLRQAGAAAREMLLTAAAAGWDVPAADCRAELGKIHHPASGRSLTYGQLATAAATLPVPAEPVQKSPDQYRYIGKPRKRIDGPAIVNGSAVYGLDVRVEGMRHAVIEHAPALGARPLRWDDTETKKVPGVTAVVPLTLGIARGVAVVADTIWAATKGREALRVDWEGGATGFSSEAFIDTLRQGLGEEGYLTRREGEMSAAEGRAATTLEATYVYPFQTHAPLETMNCVADFRGEDCEVWVSTQNPNRAQAEIAEHFGLAPERIKVNVTLVGGGFGRRIFADFVLETVELSRAIGAPVQVVWTRSDDTRHGFFHPASVCRLRAGIGADGAPTYLDHKTASSDLSMFHEPHRDAAIYAKDWMPWGAFDNPYRFPALDVRYVHVDSPVPSGAWRAVYYPANVFARESFLDELAAAAGRDPLDLRLELLPGDDFQLAERAISRSGLRDVLRLAAERAGWGTPLPAREGFRRGRGIAANVYHRRTLMAQVAEVSVGADNRIRVDRIVCAVRCGQVVNPLGLEAQIESGIAWGLSAALRGKITFREGRVEQRSYRDYEVIRGHEMPRVEVHVVPHDDIPSGIGEPPVPPVAPAVANAVFAATGQRLRVLPLQLEAQ